MVPRRSSALSISQAGKVDPTVAGLPYAVEAIFLQAECLGKRRDNFRMLPIVTEIEAKQRDNFLTSQIPRDVQKVMLPKKLS